MLSQSIVFVTLLSLTHAITFSGQCAVDCANQEFLKSSCDPALQAVFGTCLSKCPEEKNSDKLAELKTACQGIGPDPGKDKPAAPAPTQGVNGIQQDVEPSALISASPNQKSAGNSAFNNRGSVLIGVAVAGVVGLFF